MNQVENGKFISEQRKLKGLTQEQLAEKMGVSINAVSKWERGLSFPGVSLYQKLCDELDISIEELINGKKDSSKTQKKKINKKLLFVYISGLILIISLITVNIVLYNKEEKKIDDYYENNIAKSIVARNVEAILKYRNDGKYPDYFGGIYISDNAEELIIQIVKEKIPEKGTKEYMYYNEVISIDEAIELEYVKYSYNELEDTYNKINDYFLNHEQITGLSRFGVDTKNNKVIVYFEKINEEKIKEFRKKVIDSKVLKFEEATFTAEIGDYECSNYPIELGDAPSNKPFEHTLLSIEKVDSRYVKVALKVYDDNTYELFTAYKGCKKEQVCNSMLEYTKSIKGTYDYDVKKIIDASTNGEDFVWTNSNQPEYVLYPHGKYLEEYDISNFVVEAGKKNKYLEEFLKQIDVDLSLCAKPEYNY